jgi:hypothetical protein
MQRLSLQLPFVDCSLQLLSNILAVGPPTSLIIPLKSLCFAIFFASFKIDSLLLLLMVLP